MSAPLLELREVSREFDRDGHRLRAVDRVSLSLDRGEVLGLAGESGSGKTTLSRLAIGLLPMTAGELRFDGTPVANGARSKIAEFRRRVQIVFQDPAAALSPRRTIAQTLMEPLAHFRLGTPATRLTRVVRALEDVGLDRSALDRFPRQFSSGQRQRIALARALACDPELLIADEIVSALDVSVQAQVLELLRRLQEERGIGVLFISHDLAVIRHLAHRVAVMYRGRIVELGPARDVFSAPAHPYTRELLAAAPRLTTEGPQPPPPHMATVGAAPAARGCPYRERCELAVAVCTAQAPAMTAVSARGAHRVECHRHESIEASDDAP